MSGKIYIGLVHYPVLNQHGQEIVTSITNLDIHDIARLVKTYCLGGYFIIQPLPKQYEMTNELIDYWKYGGGSLYNPQRKEAVSLVETFYNIEEGIEKIKAKENIQPYVIATSAVRKNHSISYDEIRKKIACGGVYFLLFGTGWGLSENIISSADYVLEPIIGIKGYNHLSVRSAASIIIDRICCSK